MKLCVLGSGSKGHSVYVEAGGTKVLFDAGFSRLRLKALLADIGVDIDEIDCVVISHEHTDHIAGLRVLGRKKPVYLTRGALSRIRRRFEIDDPHTIVAGKPCELGGLVFTPTPTSHDAKEPVAFIIEENGARAGIVTDLGSVTRSVIHNMSDLDLAVVEANHDETMLIDGPYPWDLKQRIKGRHGHLSNRQCAKLVSSIYQPRLKNILLAHLSETNNLPKAARDEALLALGGAACEIHVCEQDRSTEVFEVK